jgi:excisionase family DNA binding protein
MSPKEVAEYLHVSVALVYRLISARRLMAVKVGGQYRVTIAAVRKLLEEELDV